VGGRAREASGGLTVASGLFTGARNRNSVAGYRIQLAVLMINSSSQNASAEHLAVCWAASLTARRCASSPPLVTDPRPALQRAMVQRFAFMAGGHELAFRRRQPTHNGHASPVMRTTNRPRCQRPPPGCRLGPPAISRSPAIDSARLRRSAAYHIAVPWRATERS
jgi:hypothetical protein